MLKMLGEGVEDVAMEAVEDADVTFSMFDSQERKMWPSF
jgi:hypothetical protein